MRRIPVALITVIGSLVVAACSGRDATAPRGIAAGGADASVIPTPSTTCDFSALKTAARNYFTSNQDSAFTYDAAMQKAYNGGADGNATNIGWQIGRLVAKERLTAATTTPTAGATYLIDVLRCMSDLSVAQTNGVYPALPLSANFLNNAISVLQHGIWEVRGGATAPTQLPAAGRVVNSSTNMRDFGLPRWGAEAVGGTWPGATQYAVFGYPTNIGTLVIGSAGNINTNEVAANAFELGTLPDGTPKAGIRVGVCISVDNGTTKTANRIVHSNSQVLDYSTMTDLCDYTNTNFVASVPAPLSWYASFMRRAGSFLSPKPAFAQTEDCTDCIGGLPSGWSPFNAGAITAANVVLTLPTEPSNTVVSATPNDMAVVHAAINGVPLIGVVIDSIAVENNSGSPAGAMITATNLPQTTDANGNATVQFSVGKAGGYLVTVLGHLDSFPTQSVTSTLFNVKNP